MRGRIARVLMDNHVLVGAPTRQFPNGSPYTNMPLRDPLSRKLVAWPLLWVNACAQLARLFPEIVSPGVKIMFTPAPRVGLWGSRMRAELHAIAAVTRRTGVYTPLPRDGQLAILQKLKT